MFGVWVLANNFFRVLSRFDVMTLWLVMQIGRPVAYALAAKGEDGVKQGIEMLKNEFELTMALSGCPTIGDITRNHVKTEAERLHSML